MEQVPASVLLGRLKECIGVKANGRSSPPADTLPSTVVGLTAGVIVVGTKQGGINGLTINEKDSEIMITP